jgi:ABC-type nitrate/sulfonate/bicarbonate transport system permease component
MRNQWWKYSKVTLTRFPRITGALCCLLLWLIVSRLGLIGPTLIATPMEVARIIIDSALARLSEDENVFFHAGATIVRVLIGWSLSLLFGICIGAILGLTSTAYKIIEPVVDFFRSIPPIMVFPLFLVAFNYGEEAYISTIVFGCTPLVALTVARGFQQMSVVRLELLKVYRASTKVRLLAKMMEVLPSCILAARLAFSISIIIAVVSEMVFTPRNGKALGTLAKEAEIAFHTPIFITATLIIGLFGYAVNFGIGWLEERLGPAPSKGILRGDA